MSELADQRAQLQETMTFLGAIASGIEEAIGESAGQISYLAGKRLGMQFSEHAPKTNDIVEALGFVRDVLKANDCLWQFEPFQTHDRPSMIRAVDNGDEIMLVFRDCMIRQSLFKFGHPQKGSLCTMMYGFFSGALKNIMGKESTLDIVHAGENGCYKRLVIQNNKSEIRF